MSRGPSPLDASRPGARDSGSGEPTTATPRPTSRQAGRESPARSASPPPRQRRRASASRVGSGPAGGTATVHRRHRAAETSPRRLQKRRPGLQGVLGIDAHGRQLVPVSAKGVREQRHLVPAESALRRPQVHQPVSPAAVVHVDRGPFVRARPVLRRGTVLAVGGLAGILRLVPQPSVSRRRVSPGTTAGPSGPHHVSLLP